MKLKIVSDGTSEGTWVEDEFGNRLDIDMVSWSYNPIEGTEALLHVKNIDAEVETEAGLIIIDDE